MTDQHASSDPSGGVIRMEQQVEVPSSEAAEFEELIIAKPTRTPTPLWIESEIVTLYEADFETAKVYCRPR
eukprot:7350012-Prymnesium_polylepis.1